MTEEEFHPDFTNYIVLIQFFPSDLDIEDCMNKRSPLAPKNVAKAKNVPVITTKRNRENSQDSDEDLTKSWRQVLGNPPSRKTNIKEWVVFQKKKWLLTIFS